MQLTKYGMNELIKEENEKIRKRNKKRISNFVAHISSNLLAWCIAMGLMYLLVYMAFNC